MTMENAREQLPIWGGRMKEADVKENRPGKNAKPERQPWYRLRLDFDLKRFGKRYGILLAAAAVFAIYTICLSAWVDHRATTRVRQELAIEYASRLEQYKQEQAEQAQAEHWLSGEASREAYINQEIDAAAPVIAKLATDAQKLNEVCCMLARVMSPLYPDSFREVAAQAQQWMFYDGTDKTFTQHDRELAESIIRPYLEEGIVPNGLTSSMVYGEWTASDFVLRDSYKTTSTMHTWRYQG